MPADKAIIWSDAALDRRCYIIEQGQHKIISVMSINDKTVNEAEYIAIIHALVKARKLGITKAVLYSDSQLVIRQLTGKYKKKEPRLLGLARRVAEVSRGMDIRFEWVPREKNLAGLYLDRPNH